MEKHYGDYTAAEMHKMQPDELIDIITGIQEDDNFIVMTDSYKMTHHLLYPDGLEKVYSYLEARGGEFDYSILFGLQYYMMRYLAGVRITQSKIDQAREMNIAHFGFDCFDSELWEYILHGHGGKLPLRIKALPEGMPSRVKNAMLTIESTDPQCAAMTNITETLLMKLWAPNTVATYARHIRSLIERYRTMTSDVPAFMVDFMHHDFGYRGVSSEESARILAAANLATGFKGTDTLGGIRLATKYYDEPMAGFSVIASEHSVMCSYGGADREYGAYEAIIERVKAQLADANPASGVIILSLVSDTYNIYRVASEILPKLAPKFIGWKNNNGIPIKVVLRPDSGNAVKVLCGYGPDWDDEKYDLAERLMDSMGISEHEAIRLLHQGLFNILFDRFGSTVNSKGFRVLHPQIGCLQGDGVDRQLIEECYKEMVRRSMDIMNLNLGSGGNLLQNHGRDDQKYAMKATHVRVRGVDIDIEKNPITDPGKKSKKGRLKVVGDPGNWTAIRTLQHGDEGFETAEDLLQTVFLDGEIIKTFTLEEIRRNCDLQKHERLAE